MDLYLINNIFVNGNHVYYINNTKDMPVVNPNWQHLTVFP